MSLSSQTFGTGHPLLLLHGLFGSGENLRVLARGLEDRFTVFLPDLPNHGRSPHIDGSTHDAMADAVEEFITAHVPANPIVGGHSLGGKLAMLLALRHPDHYPAVISIDMAPRRYEPSHLEILDAMQTMDLKALSSRRDADVALSAAVPHAAVRSFLLKNLVREETGYRWRLNLRAIRSDYHTMLGWEPPAGAFHGPALFAGGERSRYLQAERDTEDIHRHFPNAAVEMIPDAGHWLHADKPEELLLLINRFLSGSSL